MNRMMVLVLAAAVVAGAANAMVVGISDTCARPHRADVMYYADTLERAGHVPVVLPYTADTNRIAAALDRVDCLLLTGGEDVEPSRYGMAREPKCGKANVRRDAYDWALLDAAVARRLPVFGVCRGEQVINAYFGGTLIQHVDGHRVGPWDGDGTNAPAHVVKIAADSRFARVMGAADLAVNSHHHQCVGRVAPGFRVVGTAPDGVVEAIEGVGYPAFAVQFHAESALANGARHPGYDKPRLLKLFRELPALVDCRSGGAKGGPAVAVRPGSPFCDNMVLQRGRPVPVWGTADPGERVTVSFAGQMRVATADEKGRWRVDLAPLEASKVPREMVIGTQTIRNVLVGEVWLAAGQSNMELPLWSEMPRYRDAKGAMVAQMTHLPNVRVGNIPITWKGSPEPRQFARTEFRWMEAEPENMRPIRKFSALGFWFARELYLALDVPVAVLAVYQGGTRIEQWTGELFNEYLAPVAPYAVRGFLWYQGESNGAKGYCEKMHGLYGAVTNAFENAALPMYFVQIPGGFDRALEQARFVREEPHAEMAVINDVANPHDVHPARKEIVAQRLVLHALARDYGFRDIVHRSPSAVAATADGDTVTVSFADAKELYIYNDDWSMSNRFAVAGADGRYAPAEILNMATTTNKAGGVQAKINGGIARDAKLVLRAPGVASPRKVRYLHDGRQLGNIFSEVNLPLQPFEIEARPASDAD